MPTTTDPSTPITSTFRWLLDTRPLWRDESFEQSASRALNLLPRTEQHTVLKHFFTADRKLRLASFLLKRLAVHRTLRVPWSAITLSTDQHGKPCYVPPTTDSSLPLSGSTRSPEVSESGAEGRGIVKFNVSHQAGLVVLIGSTDATTEVGIDVVSVDERAGRDIAAVRKEGWAKWVDIYAEVFSDAELQEMKWTLPVPVSVPVRYQNDDADADDDSTERIRTLSPTELVPLSRCWKPDVALLLTLPRVPSSNTDRATGLHGQTVTVTVDSTPLIASKIRNFYAHWCLKEAYIKMTGEALLAPWLRDLEFRNVRPPLPSSSVVVGKGKGEEEGGAGMKGEGEGGKVKWGETVDSESFEIYRFRERIGRNDGNGDGKVRVELTAWEEGFMIGSAVSVSSSASTAQDERGGKGIAFGEFEELDLERDVLGVAEAGG